MSAAVELGADRCALPMAAAGFHVIALALAARVPAQPWPFQCARQERRRTVSAAVAFGADRYALPMAAAGFHAIALVPRVGTPTHPPRVGTPAEAPRCVQPRW